MVVNISKVVPKTISQVRPDYALTFDIGSGLPNPKAPISIINKTWTWLWLDLALAEAFLDATIVLQHIPGDDSDELAVASVEMSPFSRQDRLTIACRKKLCKIKPKVFSIRREWGTCGWSGCGHRVLGFLDWRGLHRFNFSERFVMSKTEIWFFQSRFGPKL